MSLVSNLAEIGKLEIQRRLLEREFNVYQVQIRPNTNWLTWLTVAKTKTEVLKELTWRLGKPPYAVRELEPNTLH